MRFWVTKNPKVALMLIPWFVPNNQTREEIYLELIDRLTDSPDETFVCVAIEDDLIKGMAVAYCRDKDVFIWQARSDNGMSQEMVDRALGGLAIWAKGKGYDRVVTGPNCSREVFARRWGMKASKDNEKEVYLEI